jgi:malate/lactate dehydrogenase
MRYMASCDAASVTDSAVLAGVAKHCPLAVLNIIANPVNSTVPIAAEVLKAAGCFDPKKLMGVTHLDVMRARTFVAAAKVGTTKLCNARQVIHHISSSPAPR